METHPGNHLLVNQYPKALPTFDPGNTYPLCDSWGFMRRFRLVFRCVGLYICTFQLVEGLSPFLLTSRSSMIRTYLDSSRRTSSDGNLPGRTLTPVCTLNDLRTVQQQGGIIEDVSYNGVTCKVLVSGFKAEQGIGVGQRIQEVEQALSSSTLLIDQSHWGVIRVEGKDRLRFLHSQGTNAFEGVPAGKVIPTCFTNKIGRVTDFCEGVVLQNEVWLLSSPHRWRRLLQTMDKFIFPMDRTNVSSLSEEMAIFALAGPKAGDSLALAGFDDVPAPGRFVEHEFGEKKVIAICHSRPITARARGGSVTQVLDHDKPGGGRRGPDDPWFTLVVPAAVATELWSTLSASPSVVTAGEAEWQTLRIRRGFPIPQKELTDDYNPLEAGLWHSVHFDKGCYIGQESIARVNAYKALKNTLYGVAFERPGVPEGAELITVDEGKRAGVVTSVTESGVLPPAALAYIKTQAGGVGLKVETEDGVRGTVIEVPYPTRSDAESAMPPVKKDGEKEENGTASLDIEEKAREEARKAAKLEATQKKLDALRARKKTAS